MSTSPPIPAVDAAAPDLVLGDLEGFHLLRPFNQAGILAPADVHTAIRLCRLAGETDEEVALAVALAVRAPRVGHVSVSLADARMSVIEAGEEMDLDLLPWPHPRSWIDRVAASELVDVMTPVRDGSRPVKLHSGFLYLDRYWRDEASVAAEILARVGAQGELAADSELPGPSSVPARETTHERLERLFPGTGSLDQLRAARLVLTHRFAVIAGGPGTGKTTTVARVLALLFEDAAARRMRTPLVGLAAPTGKAAARMQEAVRAEAARIDTAPEVRTALTEVNGSTLHRLLGTRFDRPGRFRHHRAHRLPHDIVVVDEASMVSLSLMASLIEAVRPDARLVLVGDPEQLVSVEAGAVLADIVGPAGRSTSGPGQKLEPATTWPADGEATEVTTPADGEATEVTTPADGEATEATTPAGGPTQGGPPISSSIRLLRQNHRFAGSLARLAAAVRAGDDGGVIAILSGGDPDLSWLDTDPGELLLAGQDTAASGPLSHVRATTVAWAAALRESAAAGDAAEAIAHLRHHRVLCAHRRGAAGVRAWNRVIEGWVAATGAPVDPDTWYAGRPVMVSVNDYALRLYNGDTGVAVAVPATLAVPATATAAATDGGQTARRLAVAFDEGVGRQARMVTPTRLSAVETVYAMTVHKSQGSEFDRVTLLLPQAGSRLLTRQLLYTAITRAREAVAVVGTAEALRTAVRTPIARASGLGERLWGDADL